MRLIPREPAIGPEDGFTRKNDIFGYEAFGSNLANLVNSSLDGMVVLLDGPWGSGKSIFCKQWAGLLRNLDFPVIEFDAFKNDYQGDAFIALAGEIHDLGKQSPGDESTPNQGFLECAKKAGIAMAPLMFRVASKAATAGLLDIKDIESASAGAKEAIAVLSENATETLEIVISDRLSHRDEERQTLDEFRASLSSLANSLSSNDNPRPLVVIIDELDRCKPNFALDILEQIKHLFSVEGVVFVLVGDFNQLQAVVTGAYGSGANFDGRTYLEKFYHLRARLPLPEKESTAQRYVHHLWYSLEMSATETFDQDMHDGIAQIADATDLSLRNIERVITHVVLVYNATDSKSWRAPPIAVGLCVLRHLAPTKFELALQNKLTWSDVESTFRIGDWSNKHEEDLYSSWWQAALIPNSEIAEEGARNVAKIFRTYATRFHLLPTLSITLG